MGRLRQQDGIALIMALGVMIVISIVTISLLTYSGTNVRTVRYQNSRVSAYSMAEAGINNALSVLNLESNNALDSNLLPSVSTDADGTAGCTAPDPCVTWSGELDQASSTWTVTATGEVANPSGGSTVTKTLTVHVGVEPTLGQTLNNQAWNYIYSFKPNDNNSSTCEMTITNSVNLKTPLYVDGDLCIKQTALISEGTHGTTLVVGGQLRMDSANQNFVGAHKSGNNTLVDSTTGGGHCTGHPSCGIVAAYIHDGCKLGNNALHTTCGSADNLYADAIGTTPPASVTAPTVEWNDWYDAASPGPRAPCDPNLSSGTTLPAFDVVPADGLVNKSLATPWNLTPATSYDCWGQSGGHLAWNATTKVLTVNGTVFIDGSAYISNGSVNSFDGQGSLYLSGTFYMHNSSLCAVVLSNGSGCDISTWNPNSEALVVVAKADGGDGLSCPTGYTHCDSVQLVSSTFQGGVYATWNIELDTTSNIDGPMVGYSVILGQSVSTSFPFITWVPTGTPGNPIVYAQPRPPTGYDG